MSRYKVKGSYTMEAAIYIPFVIFLMFQSLNISIDYWQSSREKVMQEAVRQLDTVREFYMYQMMEEIGEELEDDTT